MSLLLLLPLLFFCHFLADFCFTTPTMLEAKATGKRWWHIAWHAAVHATLMGAVLMGIMVPLYGVSIKACLLLMAFELVTHFIIDYAKGWTARTFPRYADPAHKPYWVLYGLDQLLHQFVILAIVALTAFFSQYPVL
ncbi:MAG: DUF3307 domain-containing protein [Muribaculaceae bacterium]|nr:DUF3307 domain-containing protein [Muribaculaceae bacterium]MBR0024203.1 DUF3307 domain-containing protein [Muribaculaceae bacterium]